VRPAQEEEGWLPSLSTQGPGILWNTKYLEVAYTELRRQGGPINEDLLRRVAPLGWEHIGLTGDYVWSPAKKEPTDSGGAAATARAARQGRAATALPQKAAAPAGGP
jgi:Tn3 transposase DDE domain